MAKSGWGYPVEQSSYFKFPCSKLQNVENIRKANKLSKILLTTKKVMLMTLLQHVWAATLYRLSHRSIEAQSPSKPCPSIQKLKLSVKIF